MTLYPATPLLIIDDEAHILESLKTALRTHQINNISCLSDSREVLPFLKTHPVSVVLLDLNMPYISGQKLLAGIVQEHPGIPVVIITAANDADTAVDCMKKGAFDYFTKPLTIKRILACLERALQYREINEEYIQLKERFFSSKIENRKAFAGIVTGNPGMEAIFSYCEVVAKTSKPVLITGETGVGKELISRAIYNLSGLQGKFVALNIAGYDDTMFSDTLFGHRKGAFTGAETPRGGMLEQADGGMLFLDEIGDLDLKSQVKLLRLIQEGEYYPLGADIPRQSSAKIIVATNKDLAKLIETEQFRKDLFYRLQIHHIRIPPLRERTDDIPLLLEHFLKKASAELGIKKPAFPPELITLLKTYSFPGNLRELEGIVFDILSKHTTEKLSLAPFKRALGLTSERPLIPLRESSIEITGELPTIKEVEIFLIREALKRSRNNQSLAASLLGLSRQALNIRIKKLKASGVLEFHPRSRS